MAELAWREGDPEKLASFYRGIRAYRHHPYRRNSRQRSIIWQRGGSRLLDYGPEDGWPLLVVPSLINRSHILDLMPGDSLLDFLSENGMRPLLLDWGDRTFSDRSLSLEQVILDRMDPALDDVGRLSDRPPLVLGYCMGGTLAIALACLRQESLAGLALLAPPWDFDDMLPSSVRGSACRKALAGCTGSIGSAPVDLLQTLFAQIDPMNVPRKFAGFSRLPPMSTSAIRFVAIEDWLNDGVPLDAEIAAECFLDWYGRNAPGQGCWRVDGMQIRPEQLDLPVFLAVPERDRIVPPRSALPLAGMLDDCCLIRPEGGHVGMVAGAHAEAVLWAPLVTWLKRIVAMQKNVGETSLEILFSKQ